ncbi:MAG: ABC transporter substrate-binding protein [Deltaproteobacteria bacterium]
MKRNVWLMVLTSVIIVFAAAAHVIADDIVIGYSGPLTGPAAEYGQDCVNGIDMAIREINGAGGIMVKGRVYTFRLEKRDDHVDPKVALNNARQLQNDYKAVAIFNPVTTTLAPIMDINETKKNEFLVMAYSSVPEVSEKGNKLVICITTPFTIYVKSEADLAWEKGWRRGAMVVTTGSYGEGWRKAFAREWVKKGGIITVDKPTNYYTKTEFSLPLQTALDSDPDFLLIGGPSATTALIIEQARARGFEGGFVMTDQVNLDAVHQMMKKPLGLEGSIAAAMVSHISYPTSESFKISYRADYKRQPTWECVLNYTGMYALANAIYAAGTVDDVRMIRAAFPKVFPMLGDRYPIEVYGLSPGGRFIVSASMQTVRHGRFTPPNAYVWWAKTQKEYDQIKKITRSTIVPVWKQLHD